MADAPSGPSSTAPATPENGGTPQSSGGQPAPAADKPAMTASEAGKTLRQLRDAHMQQLRDKAKSKEAAAADPKAKTETTTTPGAQPGASTTAGEEKDAEPDDDLAALMKEDRRLKTEAKALEAKAAEVKDVAEVAPIIRTAREQLQKGDLGAAFVTVFGEKAKKDMLWILLRENPEAKEGEEPAADPRALVREELEARDKAEKERQEREAAEKSTAEATRLSEVDKSVAQPGFAAAVAEIPSLKGIDTGTIEAFGKYVGAVTAEFKGNTAKYRAVERIGVTPLQVVQRAEQIRGERIEAWRKAGGVGPAPVPPNAAEVLEALNNDILGISRELAGAPAPAAERPAPVGTFSADWRQGAGTPAPAEEKLQTVEERRAAIKKKLGERRTA